MARFGQLTSTTLMRTGLARMAAGLRAAVGTAAVASALVGARTSVSWWWLAPAVAAVICWTAFYVVVAWTRGLGARLIGADVVLMAVLCLVLGKVVPPQAVSGTLNWVSNIASMVVVSAQLAGLPAVSIPAGLGVTASYVAGTRFAHVGDSGVSAALVLGSQTLLAAAVMAVAMRAERGAVRVFAELEAETEAAEVAAARREEERFHQGVVHNGPLTVLAMALDASGYQLSTTLRQRAALTRERLMRLGTTSRADDLAVRLDERLAQVVLWYQPSLKITAALPPSSVPANAADAFAEAAGEAFENIVRHAGVTQARIELRDDGHSVQVQITDSGRGFDTALVPAYGFGLRKGLAGRMAAVGGSATIGSAPGAGTIVLLEWRHD
jgi:histidine kinase/DNA gyrase B/HSP90-like ATPase